MDITQPEAIRQLRQIGASVQPLHSVGSGCPDLLVGFRGVNILVEMKDGGKCEAHSSLNAAQVKWHGSWAGQVAAAWSAEEAVAVVIDAAKQAAISGLRGTA